MSWKRKGFQPMADSARQNFNLGWRSSVPKLNMLTNGLKNEVAPLLNPISKTPWRSPGFIESIVALTVPDWVLPPTWYDTTMPASSATSQNTSQGFRFIWRVTSLTKKFASRKPNLAARMTSSLAASASTDESMATGKKRVGAALPNSSAQSLSACTQAFLS